MSNQIEEQRVLSVYEKQQLLKYGLSEKDFLKQGEMPIEYFTGFVNFAGLTLQVNQEVLIPRVESEELVDQALHFVKKSQKNNLKVLEIATGSGAIALALINKIQQLNYLNKNWEFCLSELSSSVMSVAKNNYQKLLVKVVDQDKIKVKFVLSNLLDQIKDKEKFDLVLANLPYIPSQDLKKIDPSVKNFEPKMALDGGETGFELIAKALGQLIEKNFLADDALLIFESDRSHKEKFVKDHYLDLFEKFKIKFIKDQFDRQRFLQLQRI